MTFSISEFRSQYSESRNNLFEVNLFTPLGLRGSIFPASARYLCKAANIPSKVLQTIEYKTHGARRKMPYELGTEDLSLQFYVDANFYPRNMFEQWMSFIYKDTSTDNKFTMAYYDDYVADLSVFKYRVDGTIEATYAFYEAYPVSMSQLQFDWDSDNQLTMFQVDMAFRYFEYLP